MGSNKGNMRGDTLSDLEWFGALLSLSGPVAGLIPGEVDIATFHILADLARIRNPGMLNALEEYLVHGQGREKVCAEYGVNTINFTRRLAAINRAWFLTEALRGINDKNV
ncbi:hypothetical protein ABVX93_003737 [Escherichia coli]|nr:hypothetical protein [Shigella flexneri]